MNASFEGPVIYNALCGLFPRLDALALLENLTIGLIPEELEQMSWHLKFTKLKANVECGIPNSKCESLWLIQGILGWGLHPQGVLVLVLLSLRCQWQLAVSPANSLWQGKSAQLSRRRHGVFCVNNSGADRRFRGEWRKKAPGSRPHRQSCPPLMHLHNSHRAEVGVERVESTWLERPGLTPKPNINYNRAMWTTLAKDRGQHNKQINWNRCKCPKQDTQDPA